MENIFSISMMKFSIILDSLQHLGHASTKDEQDEYRFLSSGGIKEVSSTVWTSKN